MEFKDNICEEIYLDNICEEKYLDNICEEKYIDNIEYVYNNIDKFMEIDSFKNYIDNSEHILQKYHQIYNTEDRNEVIAKYIMLTLYLLLNKF